MIFATELILEIFFAYKVLTEKNRTKLFLWFMTAMILLAPGFKLMPGIPSVNWMFPIICLVRIINDGTLIRKWSEFPLKYIYAAILIFHFIQPLFVHFLSFRMTYFYVIQYVMTTYIYVFLGYCMAPDYNELMSHKRWIYSLIIILFIIAAYSKLITYNFISSELNDSDIWTSDRAFTSRGFRVTATQSSPNIFGYVNVFLALFVVMYKDKLWRKGIFLTLILTNIFLCGTRAPMLGLITSMLSYALFINKGKLISTTLLALFAVIVTVNIVGSNPVVENYVNGVVDLFTTGGKNTGGSTAEARTQQLAVATAMAVESPIWGSGNGYCNAIQDEKSKFHTYYDSDLLGAEGVLFYMLIDYGFVYTGLCGLFFISLFHFYFRHYKQQKKIVMLAVPMTIALLTHLATSRPDNSWQIFMPIMGAGMYMLQTKKKDIMLQ